MPVPLLDKGAKASKALNGIQVFVGIPRTHTEQTTYCYKASYRPELTVMVTNGTHFFLTYVSDPMDFGVETLLSSSRFHDPCDSGRIVIVNSISDWDTDAKTAQSGKTDVMTVTLTVNDATVQAMRFSGILGLIRGLPSIQRLIKHPEQFFGPGAEDVHRDVFERHQAVGQSVRACAEQSARQYIDDHTAPLEKKRIMQGGKRVGTPDEVWFLDHPKPQ